MVLETGHPIRRIVTRLAYKFGVESPDIPPGELDNTEKLMKISETEKGDIVYYHNGLGRYFFAESEDD